jgi:hypothetical protein
VNQQNTPTLEPNNQILPAAIELGDALPAQSLCYGSRLERTSQTWISNLRVPNPPSCEERRELSADRLDFG